MAEQQAGQRAWHHASVRELPGVLATAGRLFLAHWPAFLVLAFLGVAARNAAIWAAIEVSEWNGLVAQVLLIIAPLGYLLPVIAMLHISRRSLGDPAVDTERKGGLLGVAAAVLIPFLTVYVANGLLEADRHEFLNAAAFDELESVLMGVRGEKHNLNERLGVYPPLVLFSVVVIAFAVRWGIGRFQKRWSFLALGLAAAVVEVYWTGLVARNVEAAEAQLRGWLDQRQAAHLAFTTYDDVTSKLGAFKEPVTTAVEWLLGLIGAVDAVVIVPLAWLVVAAVVLGHDVMPEASDEHPWLERVRFVPKPVLLVLEKLTEEWRERWTAFWQGLKMLGNAGLMPMLAFSLAFLLVLRAGWFVGEVVRVVVGPMANATYLAFSLWEQAIAMSVSMVAMGPLLAAAAHWLVSASQARRAEGTNPTPGASPTPA